MGRNRCFLPFSLYLLQKVRNPDPKQWLIRAIRTHPIAIGRGKALTNRAETAHRLTGGIALIKGNQ
jgi:hypothetical protein